jgi:hypothetical protein
MTAYAQEAQIVATPALTPEAEQVIYKGVVGNLLETVPIDPDSRVQLQKGNAVVSNAMAGRSLAILLGVANPIFLVAGLAWGVWAASRIKPAAPAVEAPAIQEAKADVPAASEPAIQEAKADLSPANESAIQEAKADVPAAGEPAVDGN